MTTTSTAKAVNTKRRWTRLIPVILVIYIIAYIDRVNIGFGAGQIREELGIDASQAGFAAGIFFIGYLFLQVPGGYFAQRYSAKWTVFALMIGWGVAAIACGFVQTYEQLLVARFILGVFEGGVQPALMVLINRWFAKKEKATAFSLFIMHNPIATIITGPFAGWILLHGTWRELFIIQGALPLVVGVGLWLWIAFDTPEKARWATPEERAEIAALKAEDGDANVTSDWRQAVRSPYVWILAVMGMFVWLGFYGLQLWLPTLLREMFTGELTVGLVFAIPPIVAAAAIWYNGRGADRDRRYNLRVAVPLILGGLILAASTLISGDSGWLVVAALALATACQLSFFGPYWTINSTLVAPAAIGAGFGIINGIGNLGGLLGPYIGGWIIDRTGSVSIATLFFGVSVLIAGLIALSLTGAVRRTLAANAAAAAARQKA